MNGSVYLDHAATTPLDGRVLEAMLPFFTDRFGNASSVHAAGRAARHALEEARERVAAAFGVEVGDVIFTSGGTEANNAALFGVASGVADGPVGIITASAEHEAVLRPATALEDAGHIVTVIAPDEFGAVSPALLADAIDDRTRLVSLMWVNNELGTLNSIGELAAICRERNVLFHTDAVQAVYPFADHLRDVDADLISISAHKLGGPKGVGALIARGPASIEPRVLGGSQERGRRAGTENLPGVVGLAAAVDIAVGEAASERRRLRELQEWLMYALRHQFGEHVRINTPPGERSAPHIVNASFTGPNQQPLDGEMLLLGLDMAGVMVSSGSACASGAVEPSHVLRAVGVPREWAAATVRFSLGRDTTPEALERAMTAAGDVLARQGVPLPG